MDSSMILSILPKVIVFLVFFLGIGLAVEYFYLRKHKTNKPLSPDAIPPIPQENAGTAKFATNYQAVKVSSPSKFGKNKNAVVLLGVGALLVLTLLGVFIATRKQPTTTKSHANANHDFDFDCMETTFHVQAGDTISGNTYTLTYTITNTSASRTYTVMGNPRFYSCDGFDPSSQCQQNEQNLDPVTFNLGPGETHTGSISKTRPDQRACGSVQADFDVADIQQVGGTDHCTYTRGQAQAFGYNGFPDLEHPLTCSGSQPTNTPAPGAPTATPTPVNVPPGNPTATPTPGSISYKVWGRVINLETNPVPASCYNLTSPAGVPEGIEDGQNISLSQTGGPDNLTRSVISSTSFGIGHGGFRFDAVSGGGKTYSACIDKEAVNQAGYKLVCANPGNAPTGASVNDDFSCINFSVTNFSIGEPIPQPGIRFVIQKVSNPSATPTIPGQSRPTPTPICSNDAGCLTPTPTRTPSATPTPIIVNGSPAPTQYIVINPTSTTVEITATPVPINPTIPSTGSPLPAMALGIPLLLIMLAFLL